MNNYIISITLKSQTNFQKNKKKNAWDVGIFIKSNVYRFADKINKKQIFCLNWKKNSKRTLIFLTKLIISIILKIIAFS